MVSIKKEKTNLYLNKDLKNKAKEKLSKYGLTLSSFTNLIGPDNNRFYSL